MLDVTSRVHLAAAGTAGFARDVVIWFAGPEACTWQSAAVPNGMKHSSASGTVLRYLVFGVLDFLGSQTGASLVTMCI